MKHWIYIALLCLLANPSFAGKIKSSNALLPKIEQEMQAIQNVITEIKNYIEGVGETGSFVKNDFWCIKPAFYFDHENTGIKSLYFLHEPIDQRVNDEVKNKYFVRTINNIKLNPEELESWRITLKFHYTYLFPENDLMAGRTFSNNDYVRQYFLSNNVPSENLETALQEYTQKYGSVVDSFAETILIDIDKLYSAVYVGDKAIDSRELFMIFNREKIHDMKTHPEIIKNNLDKFRLSSLRETQNLKTNDQLFEAIAIGNMNEDVLSLDVSVYRTPFEVGKYLDSSQRTSQIIDFDLLLNKKVGQGKAVSTNVVLEDEVYTKRPFTAYSDTQNSVKYPASVYFNKETGKGIWENGYWKSKEDLNTIREQLDQANNTYEQTVRKYFEMVMKEIATKYQEKKENSDSTNFNDEF